MSSSNIESQTAVATEWSAELFKKQCNIPEEFKLDQILAILIFFNEQWINAKLTIIDGILKIFNEKDSTDSKNNEINEMIEIPMTFVDIFESTSSFQEILVNGKMNYQSILISCVGKYKICFETTKDAKEYQKLIRSWYNYIPELNGNDPERWINSPSTEKILLKEIFDEMGLTLKLTHAPICNIVEGQCNCNNIAIKQCEQLLSLYELQLKNLVEFKTKSK